MTASHGTPDIARELADATTALLDALSSHDPVSETAVSARARHVEAVLATGEIEDAFYAAEELAKDCLREHGEDSDVTRRAREALSAVEKAAEERGLKRLR